MITKRNIIFVLAAIVTITGISFSDVGKAIGSSIVGYTGRHIEKQEREFLLSMREKCRQEGRITIQELEEKGENIVSYEYTYNQKRITCLLYTHYKGGRRFVTDLLTNEILVAYNPPPSISIAGGESFTVGSIDSISIKDISERTNLSAVEPILLNNQEIAFPLSYPSSPSDPSISSLSEFEKEKKELFKS